MTTYNFFQQQFCVSLSDEQVATALVLSGVDDTDIALADLTEEQRQLTRAHLMRMLVQSYVSVSSKTASDAFSAESSTGSLSEAQIAAMRSESNRIFKMYGQDVFVQNVNAINIYDDEEC